MAEDGVVFEIVFLTCLFLDLFFKGVQRIRPVYIAIFVLFLGPSSSIAVFLIFFLTFISLLVLTLFMHQFINNIFLIMFHLSDKDSQTRMVDFTLVGQVSRHEVEAIFINPQQNIDSSLSNGQTGNMRQEVIPDKETQKHEVI